VQGYDPNNSASPLLVHAKSTLRRVQTKFPRTKTIGDHAFRQIRSMVRHLVWQFGKYLRISRANSPASRHPDGMNPFVIVTQRHFSELSNAKILIRCGEGNRVAHGTLHSEDCFPSTMFVLSVSSKCRIVRRWESDQSNVLHLGTANKLFFRRERTPLVGRIEQSPS